MQVATVINFCTNETRYLVESVKEALQFSSQVLVVVADHLFDGTKEDPTKLHQVYTALPECQFIEYPFIPDKIPKEIFQKVRRENFWHSLSRLIGSHFVLPEMQWILFLDSDEIVEGKRFQKWLNLSRFEKYKTLKLASYWYFREPQYQATVWEDSPVLVEKEALKPSLLLSSQERNAIYDDLIGPKRRNVTGFDGKPMIHHYSWVRTKEEMLKKTEAWGHKKDRSWASLIEEEFSRPFQGKDFVHGYSFSQVTPAFPISLDPNVKLLYKGEPNLYRMREEEVLALLEFMKKKSGWQRALNFLLGRSA